MNGQVLAANYARMHPGESINEALENLPIAEVKPIFIAGPECNDFESVTGWRTVKVTHSNGKSEFVACPTSRYRVVLHKDAFRPIIEGMTQAGVNNFHYLVRATARKAEMQIYATGEGYDTVSLGFIIRNSYDGTSAVKYGFRQFSEKKWIEIVGYRQVCSNGMVMRVPLDRAEFVRPEVFTKVQELLKMSFKVRHTRGADAKVKAMQYLVEAISLLREPVEAIIKKAEKWSITDEAQLRFLIEKHVSKRKANVIIARYAEEPGDSLWDLYNAITNVASHDERMNVGVSDRLLQGAARMLYEEL